MPTQHLRTFRKRQAGRPGLLLLRARRYAKNTIIAFLAVSALGIAMIVAGIDVPGRAFTQGEQDR